MKFEGTWTALVTPFNEDYTIDWASLEKNVEFQIEQGVNGLLPVGTTGESPTLDWDEHNALIEKVISQSGGRTQILAGTGSNSTDEAIVSTEHAVRAGAEAVLLVDCYYNGPSSQELREEYYAQVAKRFLTTDIVVYVIPGRTGTSISPEDIAILAAEYPNVSTVKEATGDLERMARTRKLVGKDVSIMSGDDDITYKMMTDSLIKANGVISVASNIIPGALQRLTACVLAGDMEDALKLKNAMEPLLGIVTVKTENERTLPDGTNTTVADKYRNPLPYKTLMAGLGMIRPECRKPLGKMSVAGVETVRKAASIVWDENPEILEPIELHYKVDIEARLKDDDIWASLAV